MKTLAYLRSLINSLLLLAIAEILDLQRKTQVLPEVTIAGLPTVASSVL